MKENISKSIISNIEELINKFTENNPKYREELMRLYDKEDKKRNLLELEDYEILEAIIETNKNIMSPKVFFTTRFVYYKFWEWALKKKYTMIENPFETSHFLDRTAMIVAFAESKTDVNVLTPKDIDELVNDLVTKNGEIGYIQEIIIRGLFEGIKSLKDLAKIKISQIDFDNRTIEFKGKKKKFSEKFFNCLEKYNDLQTITYQKNGVYTVQLIRYKDYLIKFNMSDKNSQNQFLNDEDFVNKTRQKLNYYLTKFKENNTKNYSVIRANVLFYSGVLQYMYSLLENQENINSLMTCMIFYNGSNPTGKTIKQLLKEYDYNYNPKKRAGSTDKEILQLFLVKSPYFDPNSLNLDSLTNEYENLFDEIIF